MSYCSRAGKKKKSENTEYADAHPKHTETMSYNSYLGDYWIGNDDV